MEPIKKRLHLDRTEILMVLGIVFLMSSLMFTLGVMVGLGVSPEPKSSGHAELSEKHGEHGEVAGEHGKGHGAEKGESEGRAPASVGKGRDVPGSELRKAFRDSKQRALVDIMLRDNRGSNAPKSIDDAQAHYEANKDMNRGPASAEESTEDAPKKSKGVAKAPGAGNVRGLFERKPSSKEKFSPTSGTFTVQVGSYASPDESEAKVLELRKSGFGDAYVHTVKTKKGDTWYRVAIGSFPKEQWAKKMGERVVKRKLASDFFIRQVE